MGLAPRLRTDGQILEAGVELQRRGAKDSNAMLSGSGHDNPDP
jgi:hypothetical protein